MIESSIEIGLTCMSFLMLLYLSREELNARVSFLVNAINESSIKLQTLTDAREKKLAHAANELIRIDQREKRLTSVREKSLVKPSFREDKVSLNQEPSRDPLVNHRILFLNDTMHENTPINVMMSWYGEANGGGSCSKDFGNELINRWRDVRKPYCSATTKTGSGSEVPVQSSIDCFLIRQTRHFGDGDNLCLMKNVALNIGEP